jgi:single-strand DNA-binding protein
MRSTKQSTTTQKTSTEKPETSQQTSRSNSVNQVTLVGRLVADPQLRETGNGKHVTTVRIATNTGASAEFHNVVLWGQLADFATGYLKKGRLVYVAGRIQTRSWTAADGSTRNSVEVVASRLQALSSKSADGPAA